MESCGKENIMDDDKIELNIPWAGVHPDVLERIKREQSLFNFVPNIETKPVESGKHPSIDGQN
jgi:hypothetical protein